MDWPPHSALHNKTQALKISDILLITAQICCKVSSRIARWAKYELQYLLWLNLILKQKQLLWCYFKVSLDLLIVAAMLYIWGKKIQKWKDIPPRWIYPYLVDT